ncbi:MAG: hypothetical protein ACKOGN_07925 [Gammaproteobacteria bacterium]
MLSPVGLPPQLPAPPDPELAPAMDRAISIPGVVGAAARWEVGSVLTATVRFQKDELLLKIGDHFFSSRPIPGVSEYSRLSLQVARDLSGQLSLVPLLPLAGKAMARIGGAPTASGRITGDADTAEILPPVASLPSTSARAPTVRAVGSPVRNLSARLHLPSSLAGWLLGSMASSGAAGATSAAAAGEVSLAGASVSSWMQALASTLSQSGLFFESQLRDRRTVPLADLKRRLLEIIEARQAGANSAEAWAALDDLVGLQSAATAAHRSGGTCYSFLMPMPDGLGGWWITMQRDAANGRMDYSGGDGRQEGEGPWRTRLVGISLPFGDIDIRIEQMGVFGIGVTVLTDTADERSRWEESRAELARRLQEAGLSLSRWAVIDPQVDALPPSSPGQLHSVRV